MAILLSFSSAVQTLSFHDRFSSRGSDAVQGGGIGAALSQYTTSNDMLAAGNENLSNSNRFRGMNASESIGSTRGARMASPGGLFTGRSAQFHEIGGRGMSPLLLPPPGAQLSNMTGNEPPDFIRPEDRSLSSTLLPRDYRALAADGASSRSLNTGNVQQMIRKPLTTSPLLSGELFVEPVCFDSFSLYY